MAWLVFIAYSFVTIALVSIPIYRLETIKYKEYHNVCWDNWNKAEEFSELHLCRNPSMRDRYRDFTKCEEIARSLLVKPEECAYRVWWGQFFLVKWFEVAIVNVAGIYASLSGGWYVYLLCTILGVVFVWTWVNSRARLQDRREERVHQHKLLQQFSRQLGYREEGDEDDEGLITLPRRKTIDDGQRRRMRN